MSVLPQRVSAWRAPALLLLRTAVLARPSRSACRVGAQFVLVDLGPHTDTLHKVGGAGAAGADSDSTGGAEAAGAAAG